MNIGAEAPLRNRYWVPYPIPLRGKAVTSAPAHTLPTIWQMEQVKSLSVMESGVKELWLNVCISQFQSQAKKLTPIYSNGLWRASKS